MDTLDTAEREVLTENTAQAVLKHLHRLEDARSALGTRWVWELLQNARDAARPAGVTVAIDIREGQLCFRHSGRPFKHKEVAHLIYHGTTKLSDEGDVGHFGSGFLSTHLLSRKVRVRGSLEGGHHFDFWLDRSGQDPDELAEAMRRSMEDCKRSSISASSIDGAKTEFEFPLDEDATVLARKGVEDLRSWGPLVLALTPEFTEIKIESDQGPWSLVRGETVSHLDDSDEYIMATVELHQGGSKTVHAIAIASQSDTVQAALPLAPLEKGFRIVLDHGTPRIFILFPLLGTERLALPGIAQSKGFEPLEDRDGLVLDGDSPRASKNKKLLEEAVQLMTILIELAARQKWTGIQHMLTFDTKRVSEKVDQNWLNRIFESLVERVRSCPLMPTVSGQWICPRDSHVPHSDHDHIRTDLWNLAVEWTDMYKKLPPSEALTAWSECLRNWTEILGKPIDQLSEALTVEKMAQMISDEGSVEALHMRLGGDKDPVEWLARFLQLLCDNNKTNLLDDLSVLPSQVGNLRKRNELSIDEGVCEELKDIGASFGIELRENLLDRRAAVGNLSSLLAAKQEQQALDEILAALRNESQDGWIPTELIPDSVNLFSWIVAREPFWDRLDQFPVASMDSSDDKCTIIKLVKNASDGIRPLAPEAAWPEEAMRFAHLFPKKRLINTRFSESQVDADGWTKLEKLGYLWREPLYQAEIEPTESALSTEPLTENQEKEHTSNSSIRMSLLACLKDKDVGLIDSSRKSRTRAIEFIRFLFEYVLPRDTKAFDHVPVPCECGTQHEFFRAAWLDPIKKRKWIPPDGDRADPDYVSAESLARLLKGHDNLVRRPESGPCKSLLLALGISPADFALRVIAPDEDTRVSLIRSVGDLSQITGGAEQVAALVQDIANDPKLLNTISERKLNREKVRQNQYIGELVEKLLREQLERHGLRVERTGKGSDYEVDNDFVEDEGEVFLELGTKKNTTLVEVKSTRTDSAKMTPTQVETACREAHRFVLCVIPVVEDEPSGEDIRKNSRFVFDIGSQLAEVWTAYQSVEGAMEDAQRPTGDLKIEIAAKQVRFRIASRVWEKGVDFEKAVAEFVARITVKGE